MKARKLTVEFPKEFPIVSSVVKAMFEEHGKLHVVIKQFSESRSDEQKGYYFVLCGVIGAEVGNTKDQQHEIFKERFLLRIYLNDLDNHPEFLGVVENMQIIKKNCPPDVFEQNRRLVISGVSTNDATMANMSELIKEVHALALDQGIRLPAPPREYLS